MQVNELFSLLGEPFWAPVVPVVKKKWNEASGPCFALRRAGASSLGFVGLGTATFRSCR